MKMPMKITLMAIILVLFSLPVSAVMYGQEFKLLPDDGEAYGMFGWSVALSGNLALVGASEDEEGTGSWNDGSGSAYLFDTTTGEQLHKLLPAGGATTNDGFGMTVALSENLALVGARGYRDNGYLIGGCAYVFDVSTGEQLHKPFPDDGSVSNAFGWSVAMSGNLALIGAPLGVDFGSAYVFDATTGEQLLKLLPDDGATASEGFGLTVAISSNLAMVGAPYDGDFGSAYLFDATTGEQLCKLLPDDSMAGNLVGGAIALSGNLALVAAQGMLHEPGRAYLFDVTTGEQLYKLLPDDGSTTNNFGCSVALNGGIAVVGACGDSNGTNPGSLYLFDVTTGEQLCKLLPDGDAADDVFGMSVAVSNGRILAGAVCDSDQGVWSGSAYVFEMRPSITSCTALNSGVILEWDVFPAWRSTVKWSTNLVTMPFTNLVSDIAYPVNSYTDSVHAAEGQCFYTVEIAPETD